MTSSPLGLIENVNGRDWKPKRKGQGRTKTKQKNNTKTEIKIPNITGPEN